MKRKNDKEAVSQKSSAVFFSEHQQIAGFDNPGKSLFTTIREFVENSLDGKLLRIILVCPCVTDDARSTSNNFFCKSVAAELPYTDIFF